VLRPNTATIFIFVFIECINLKLNSKLYFLNTLMSLIFGLFCSENFPFAIGIANKQFSFSRQNRIRDRKPIKIKNTHKTV
jgi:hypothetical protein